MLRIPTIVAIGALLIVAPKSSAQQDHDHNTSGPISDAQLGLVAFANSGAPRAQTDFLRGLALLHSFMYGPSAIAFQSAQKSDPKFAMAYWGEAMTYVHAAWRQEDLTAANAALDRLAPTREERLARAGTPRERRYGAAVEALVANGVPEQQRRRAFSDTMHALAAKYPTDLDARSFAALGGMITSYLWPAADSTQRERDHAESEALAYGVQGEPEASGRRALSHSHQRRSHLRVARAGGGARIREGGTRAELSRVARYLVERFEVPKQAGLRMTLDRDPVQLL